MNNKLEFSDRTPHSLSRHSPVLFALLFTAGFLLGAPAARLPVYASPGRAAEAEVRAAVLRIFDLLRAADFSALYDALPLASRARISRERFTTALQRTRNLYQLDRIDIGAVRVSGNIAVVDTVMYAHITRPIDGDGKLVVQQYLVREDGSWRVATGDRATIERFLKSNRSFAHRFPIRPPRAFIKQNGSWVEIHLPTRQQR